MLKPNAIAKIILLSFSSLTLLGTFQNCAQSSGSAAFTPGGSGTSAGAENSDSLEKIENLDLSSAEYINVSLKSLYSEPEPRRLPKDYLSKNYQNLKINLINGEMRSVDSDGIILSPIRFCLRSQELEELKVILRNSRLCRPTSMEGREDVVCSQIYKYPFAWLQYANGENVKLGEVSGCTKSLDLCMEYRNVFNGFVAYLRNNVESRICL